MQKILFVGIILLIGLFSLQYALTSMFEDVPVYSDSNVSEAQEFVPVIFITPADTTVCVDETTLYIQKL